MFAAHVANDNTPQTGRNAGHLLDALRVDGNFGTISEDQPCDTRGIAKTLKVR